MMKLSETAIVIAVIILCAKSYDDLKFEKKQWSEASDLKLNYEQGSIFITNMVNLVQSIQAFYGGLSYLHILTLTRD